jgi:hypothetical protein
MNKVLPNQEHLEAHQETVNKKRNKFIESLSNEERLKFEAVEKAVQILVDVKILFYLLPYLPCSDNKDKNQVWQWNSLQSLAEFGNDGKPTEEYRDLNSKFHNSFYSALIGQIVPELGKSTEETLTMLPYFIHSCLIKNQEYMKC